MINIPHNSVTCGSFKTEEAPVEREKTVIIGPIRIFEDFNRNADKAYEIIIGCNMFRVCTNTDCGYSWVSRQRRKESLAAGEKV